MLSTQNDHNITIFDMSATTKTVPQNSLAEGGLSVAILFGLTGLGAFSAKTLNSPEHSTALNIMKVVREKALHCGQSVTSTFPFLEVE